ncbi:MAG: hypothetical protein Tsb0014_14170 [Pleurocapsa sp.]
MQLTYRGIPYREKVTQLPTTSENQEIIYRGNSPQALLNPKFPWLKYIQQLFNKSQNKPILDPIAFWYNHKRQFLEDCWLRDNVKQLHHAWSLSIKPNQALQAKPKTQLKYRGVTYYR